MATVFEELRNGDHYDIRDEKYQKEVHGEIDRCRHLCWEINNLDPDNKDEIIKKEHELVADMQDGAFLHFGQTAIFNDNKGKAYGNVKILS